MKPSALLLGLCFGYYLLNAQNSSFSFEHFGAEENLIDAYAEFIYRDSRDLVWISSIGGLQQYDGNRIHRFLANPKDSTALQDNYIQSDFFEDDKRRIWFAVFKGIQCYDWDKNRFFFYQVILPGTSQLANQPDTIQSDYHLFHLQGDSLLWLKAGDHIVTFNVHSKKVQPKSRTRGYRFAVDHPKGAPQQIVAMPWKAASGFEYYRIDPDRKLVRMSTPPNASGAVFNDAHFQDDDNCWLVSDRGLFHFNTQNQQASRFYRIPGSANDLRKIHPHNQYQFWVGEAKTGLWLFDSRDQSFLSVSKADRKAALSGQLSNNTVYGIYQDSFEQLWISNSQQQVIDRAWLKPHPFQQLLQDQEPMASVNVLVQDKDSTIWCGLRDGGLFKLDQNGAILKEYFFPGPFKNVFDIYLDRKGDLYCLLGPFIYRYDRTKDEWALFFSFEDQIPVRLIDLGDNAKLINTNAGYYRLENQQGNLVLEPAPVTEKGYNSLQIFHPVDSLLFVPYNGVSLKVFNIDNGELLLRQDLTLDVDILDILYDAKRQLYWLATSIGLFQSKDALQFRELDYLFQEPTRLNNLVLDDQGMLWIVGNNTLWKYNPDQPELFHFTKADGIKMDQFSLYASLHTLSGKLWFGGENGILEVDPEAVKPFPKAPPVYLQEMSVNDKPYTIPENINSLNDVRLPAGNNSIVMYWQIPTYYLPRQARLFFRVSNQDSTWQSLPNGEPIRLLGIEPGEYQLELFAKNANGLDGPIRQFNISIPLPLTQRWYFWLGITLIIALVSVGFAVAIVRRRANRRVKEQQVIIDRQNALERERNRIGSELHDDLGSGLSTIRFLSDPALHDQVNDEQSRLLNRIYLSAVELMENMSDIIWSMNSENDSLEDFLELMEATAYRFGEDHQWQVEVDLQEDLPDKTLTGRDRRNLMLVFKEVLHNIVKHAAAAQVTISVRQLQNGIRIQIEDDGNGIVSKDHNDRRSGNGIPNMEKRMKEVGGTFAIYSTPGEGTKVVLFFPAD